MNLSRPVRSLPENQRRSMSKSPGETGVWDYCADMGKGGVCWGKPQPGLCLEARMIRRRSPLAGEHLVRQLRFYLPSLACRCSSFQVSATSCVSALRPGRSRLAGEHARNRMKVRPHAGSCGGMLRRVSTPVRSQKYSSSSRTLACFCASVLLRVSPGWRGSAEITSFSSLSWSFRSKTRRA